MLYVLYDQKKIKFDLAPSPILFVLWFNVPVNNYGHVEMVS